MAKINHIPDSAKITSETYATWGEYRAALAGLDPASSTYAQGGWSGGVSSIGDALTIADRGWPEGMEQVHKVAMPALAVVSSIIAPSGGWEYEVTGAAYDVGTYIAGIPECWATPEVEAVRPVITIAACTTSSAMVPAKMLTLRGVGVVALALALQSAGYAVQIHSIEGGVQPDQREAAFTRTTLSDPQGGALDTDRVLFALAHPAACRTLAYSNLDRVVGKFFGSSYPADPPARLGWESDIYLPCAMSGDADWQNAETVIAWVKARLAEVQARTH
jgi:hypothetical protein